jgi:AcrR family transcriptional regulator
MQMKTYHVGDLRNVLLKTALEMLAEDGAEAISLRAVARRAGVSAMAPYRHYSDKSALLAAIATAGYIELLEKLGDADRRGPSRRKLGAQGVAYVQFALDNPALFRLMSGPRLEGDHPELVAAGQACYDVLRARVATGGLRGNALEERVLGAWCLMHGLAALMLDGKLVDKHLGSSDEIAKRVMKVMLDAGEASPESL